MRCLSYRLIKIHRKFSSAYLFCDKASLRLKRHSYSLNRSFFPLSENMDPYPKKNELFSEEMHLKIPLLSWGLKLLNTKPGC
jgi:hypothetical protein